jgi:hypothetical protein
MSCLFRLRRAGAAALVALSMSHAPVPSAVDRCEEVLSRFADRVADATCIESADLTTANPALRFRRGACRYASLADLYCAFGMTFLRSCYHQIL